jgi:hypothetical protein
MKKAVIGIVPNRATAELVIERLQALGTAAQDISVLVPDSTRGAAFVHEKHSKAPEGAAAGAGTGGVLGGALGVLAGIGALAIPGLGPFIAAGPILAGLSGIAAGAALGSLAGVLVGMGIPEVEAKVYESRLRSGNVLVAVHTEDHAERARAEEAFRTSGVKDVSIETERRGAALGH